DVFVFEFLNLDVNGGGHFVRLVAGERECIERKKMGVLVAGQSTKTRRIGSNFLVAYQCSIETRSASVRHQVGDCVVDGVIAAAVVGPVIALEIEWLRHVLQNDPPLGILR